MSTSLTPRLSNLGSVSSSWTLYTPVYLKRKTRFQDRPTLRSHPVPRCLRNDRYSPTGGTSFPRDQVLPPSWVDTEIPIGSGWVWATLVEILLHLRFTPSVPLSFQVSESLETLSLSYHVWEVVL